LFDFFLAILSDSMAAHLDVAVIARVAKPSPGDYAVAEIAASLRSSQ
jgi:hypothetical protein